MSGLTTRLAALTSTLTPRALVASVAVLGLAFTAAVLIPGLELATELASTTASLKFVGDQQRYPEIIRNSIETIRDRLSARGYVESSLAELREAVHKFDEAQSRMAQAHGGGWLEDASDTAALAGPSTARHVTALAESWREERESLAPLLAFQGLPYKDDEVAGTALNESGRSLQRDANLAARNARRLLPNIETELGMISAELQAANAHSALKLRIVMLAGLTGAAVLLVVVTVLLGARRKQATSLREARQQTENILRTVKDGLFLLDQDMTIGSTYSTALEGLFQRRDFPGLKFEELLRDIVSEKTLMTARKFVSVLWAERTNENLVKSINPLGEVEVRLPNSQGGIDTRYLEFDFHRVRVDGRIANVLVSVSDITARVELSRELSASQHQAQAQVDTLLGILQVDPAQLASFLSDTDASMKMINAVLREPAREEAAFRRKIDSLFRQAHSVKGEAASLGLSSIESRAHAVEDDLRALREKSELSGNDFLPLVIKLDDLLTHLQSLNDLVSRLSRLQPRDEGSPSAATRETGPREMLGRETSVRDAPAAVEPGGVGERTSPDDSARPDMVPQLTRLAERIASENDKAVELECVGFDAIPSAYRRLVKDVAVQAVRNSIVHGIEPRAQRAELGKPETGTVKLDFLQAPDGYKFIIEDDGQGLSIERIKDAAVQKGMLTPEYAASLDAKQTFSLLFQAGFSMAEGQSAHAGRGVGMNLIAERVRDAGGRVAVATQLGKFTRLAVSLPTISKRINVTEAA
jgi:HPt (histidine-containing phosphotransfer) domain-containing protein/PAS domain-containing protein